MSGYGGPRPGAGRPKSGKALKAMPVKFSAEQLAYIGELAERDSKSRAAIVRRLVDWAIQHANRDEL